MLGSDWKGFYAFTVCLTIAYKRCAVEASRSDDLTSIDDGIRGTG